MPGITGIISKTARNAAESEHALMVSAMQYESFYRSGSYSSNRVNVQLGWTVLPGSSTDCMPVVNGRGDRVLIFAGEHFENASASSARRVMALYEELGESFVSELNGWFAGVLVDLRERKVVLFNDRYGMHRIYFHETEEALYFSSEAKALLQAIPSLREINQEALAEYVAFDCVLGEKTLFHGISTFPGGSRWTFAPNGQWRRDRYFDPGFLESEVAIDEKNAVERLRAAFTDILPRYLQPAGRVAISLTAGLDTRLIVAAAQDIRGVPAYTFAGSRDTFDVRQARRVAETCGLKYEVIRLDTDFLKQFSQLAEQTVYISDGTFGVGGTHNLYLNRHARKTAPVRLTGLFGSEVVRQGRILPGSPEVNGILDPGFLQELKRAETTGVAHRHGHPLTAALHRDIPWRAHGSMSVENSQVTLRSPFMDNELTELLYAFPGTMRQSAELQQKVIQSLNADVGRIISNRGLASGRNPILLRALQTFLGALFKGDYWYFFDTPRWMLKLDPVMRFLKMPELLLGYQKFEHYRLWYRHELSDFVADTLLDRRTLQRSFFSGKSLQRAVEDHVSGSGNHRKELDVALTLELIMRTMIERKGSSSSIDLKTPVCLQNVSNN